MEVVLNKRPVWFIFLVIILPFISVALVISFRKELYYLGTLLPGCPSYTFLHIYCPGCGNTRSVQHLLSGDIIGSLKYNAIPLFGIILAVLAYVELLFGLLGRKLKIIPRRKSFWISVLIIFTTYFIVRNIFIIF